MDEMSCLSKSGVQFCPASIVFQTPPATPPKYHVSGSPGTPSMASARPPRNGPTCRHFIPLKSFSSIAPGGTGLGVAVDEAFGDGVGLIAKLLKEKRRRFRVIIRLR